ncbi:schwannomin-interacting protein 1 homolog isoform X2 [Plodia interpunctella]|uniref:schwannomin-interacting protein 1 homolog isoform X2 n=1 Tax=Plodia interpunctella TaxID=58824 RepID=UPI0023685E43|nr:schwannomin-interacting protein 1 homolog isoform X2 [Plodia interpunctella]
MRIKQPSNNGNVVIEFRNENLFPKHTINRRWLVSDNAESNNVYRNLSRHENFSQNYCDTNEYRENFESNTLKQSLLVQDSNSDELSVCNKQYRINKQSNVNFARSCVEEENNLEELTTKASVTYFLGFDVSSNNRPVDEERAFDHSDTDEMSEKGIQPVPRGIVNPNYPGFQHLAHTLQDYSSNIENFYQSENDMTDDDIEITEIGYENEPNQYENSTEFKNINNNNFSETEISVTKLYSHSNDTFSQTKKLDSHKKNEVPDLIKNISENANNNNNNNENINSDSNYCDADFENNFNTKDIIGDFNKEIEDEIKQLLNYNINIEDDLEELRKDIKDTFAKPIENTINNISEVVNHVIKKLVETQCDVSDVNEEPCTELKQKELVEDIYDINKENETNTRAEMSLSRPTFLLIENTNSTIADAFLSDGKDEISIYYSDYDTDKLSQNVENTIKQLSTELRKIIPKLDEMRERDKLWHASVLESVPVVVTDGNSNEIAGSSKPYNLSPVNAKYNQKESSQHFALDVLHNRNGIKNETRSLRECHSDQQSSKSCGQNAQTTTSVRMKNNSANDCDLGSFDVYNIETALPKLDFDAIENHLKAAKEAERRKHNDREEIRRRLAMGADAEEYYSLGHTERPGKKPSLHSRLQNGKNLQICFMNETASDNESQASDLEKSYSSKSSSRTSLFNKSSYNHPYQTRPLSVSITKHDKISTMQSGTKLRPSSFTSKTSKSRSSHSLGHIELKESDFYALQATLQTEARIALAQAKEMARIQMERERRSRSVSPVTEMLRRSLEKAHAPLAGDRRRVSRQLLTDMNVAQLQVIVNELHSQISSLNESLVTLLMARDELHMGQDSMLVDIEDLTRYLGVKEQTKKTKGSTKSGVRRFTSLVHK